jgi:hypothetical protein
VKPFRRVVTGHDETGKAVVLFDSENPNTLVRPVTGVVNRLFWQSERTPADISGPADRAVETGSVAPPRGGTSFRIVDFPSMNEAEMAELPDLLVAKQFGSDKPATGYRPATHPLMHRQRSLDYAIVLDGEIEMRLDDSSVFLKTGDVFVQQGTNHAWINTSGKPCRIAFVFVDAEDPIDATAQG